MVPDAFAEFQIEETNTGDYWVWPAAWPICRSSKSDTELTTIEG
jgi:hypothetical protein